MKNFLLATKRINQLMLEQNVLELPEGIFVPKGIMEETKELYHTAPATGLPLEWENFRVSKESDNYYYTLMAQEVTIIGGNAGSGKTTFMDSIITHTMRRYGWVWSIFSPESGLPSAMNRRLVENILGKSYNGRYGSTKATWEEVKATSELLNKFCFYLNPETPSMENLLEQIRFIHANFGLNAFVIDPYNTISYLKPKEISSTDFVSMFMSALKKVCLECNVQAFLISHPNKSGARDMLGNEKVCSPVDLCDSIHFMTKADSILMIHREKDIAKNPNKEVQVHIKKIRSRDTGCLGQVNLYYNQKTNKLEDHYTVNALDYGRNIKHRGEPNES